ncbi:MAG: cytochrome c [Flavobacteriaceae bacterium]|nr:cytochrome c [Flavobacteriaceae bacterium]
MKTIKNLFLIAIVSVVTLAFTYNYQNPWVVPAKYEKMTNPTDPDDKENKAIGKTLYVKQCAPCHGKEGLGDGSKAPELKGDLGDFSSEDFQKQSDGALFYKSYEGRDDMPNFRKKIPNEEDMWLVINHIRTLGE